MLNIVIAELIEGNYVLYQGDLSTKMLEKLRICVKPAALRSCCVIKAGLQLASLCTNSRGAGCSGDELPQDCGLALE
ncbi:hypothetical protein EQ836_05890 [Ectopseudomonas mendocina]|uniref:Uncharacterized protein n=1 Tax=Ectopseudomonas mendocina TaxID=300 RepID=A0ABD7RZA0_ECTME|nr:hypothetical protein [Pseudomonas mendocina]TRO15986.1 hypothetical protein EQ829_04120 [Pseudomonas mendocina]TRO20415.1 hypothetical protein EQ836_05890 [Pseudomonas mendocina]